MLIQILVIIAIAYVIIGLFIFIANSCELEDTTTCLYRGIFWGPRLVRDIFRLAVRDFKGN